jgi:bifunctional non-homologous end joining protein LigD
MFVKEFRENPGEITNTGTGRCEHTGTSTIPCGTIETREKRGGPMPAKKYRFVVHEHRSKRLHYDFRLEIGGVLKSWAVPKGPSLDPSDKRLAVMVPDHTLEYYDYEGIIPEGSYGAGPVVVWDAGTFAPIDTEDPEAALAQGRLSFELKGKKLKGAFALALMKHLPKSTGKEWLLMKKKDAFIKEGFEIETELSPAKFKTLKVKVPPCETDG